MAKKGSDFLFTLRNWQKTEGKKGVILHLSAYDEEHKNWHNVRAYVPFAINVADDKREKTTIAKFAKGDATGTRGCWLHVPVEFVPKPKEAKETEDDEDFDSPF